MKKRITVVIVTVLLLVCFAVAGCVPNVPWDDSLPQIDNQASLLRKYQDNIDQEMKGCFDFLWNEAQTDKNSSYYGLIQDRMSDKDTASIASVGFGLSALIVGAEEGYVTKEEAEERALGTLETILRLQDDDTVSWNGFLSHFINKNTGKRVSGSEISSIDTAILVCGALSVGEYFEGEVQQKALEVYSNVNWQSFELKKGTKKYFSMSYDMSKKKLSSGCWDWYAEQLMLYVLAAGSPIEEYRTTDESYYDFTRRTGSWEGEDFIYSYFGSIFTYQFSHAWINFYNIEDKNGTNWWQNSVDASLAAYQFCADSSETSKTFAEGGWGLTACDTHLGYSGKLGAQPRGWTSDEEYKKIQGTVSPCGAIGSVVFTPKQSLTALSLYQSKYRLLNGKYGLTDSYNLDVNDFQTDYIGIDKGISLLMLSNFKNGLVWQYTMESSYVKNGLEVLGFRTVSNA